VSFVTERRAYGWVAPAAKGTGGFGYDPIFISDTTGGKTWAEIDSARKDLISHRNRAIWDLMAWLCSFKQSVV
jgi:XTP/dITP diphosphohydrolase